MATRDIESQASTHNLVKLVIDVLKPRQVTYLWIMFFVLTGASYILTVAVPSTYEVRDPDQSRSPESESCTANTPVNKYVCQSFDIINNPIYAVELYGMSQKNQFLWGQVTMERQTNSALSNIKFSQKIYLNVSIFEVEHGRDIKTPAVYSDINTSITPSCDLDDQSYDCDTQTLFFVPQVHNQNYLIVINFTDANISQYYSGVNFEVAYISKDYTNYLLALRYVCLVLSIISLGIYAWRLSKIPRKHYVYEQKFILALGCFLVMFNDPFYAIYILLPTEAGSFFGSLFVVNFLVALLLFWFTSFQRIWEENTEKRSKMLTKTKLFLALVLWVLLLSAYAVFNHYYLSNPAFSFSDDTTSAFSSIKYISIIAAAFGIAFIFYGIIKILQVYSTRIWRHKMFFTFSLYFILSYCLFIFSGSYSIYNEDGTRVLLVVAITNIYIWFLQFLYAPSAAGIKQAETIERQQKRSEQNYNYDIIEESQIDLDVEPPFNPEWQDPASGVARRIEVGGIELANQSVASMDPNNISHKNISDREVYTSNRGSFGGFNSKSSIDHPEDKFD